MVGFRNSHRPSKVMGLTMNFEQKSSFSRKIWHLAACDFVFIMRKMGWITRIWQNSVGLGVKFFEKIAILNPGIFDVRILQLSHGIELCKLAIFSKNLTPNPIQKPLFRAFQPILRQNSTKSHVTRCQIFWENDKNSMRSRLDTKISKRSCKSFNT